MPFCPKCRYEYVRSARICPDCDEELVAELPAEQKPANPELSFKLVTVANFNYPLDAQVAKLKLESEGIESYIANEIVSRTVYPTLGITPVKVQVREEDAERAMEVLSREE